MASTVSKQDARITAPLSVSTTQQAVSNPATPRQYPMGSNDQTSNSDSSRSSAHGNSNHASTNEKKDQQAKDSSKSSQSASKASRASATGSKIGPYVLGKTLGIGSTGRVKVATHIETGQKVAVKIIPKQKSKKKDEKDDSESLNRKLEREIAIMKLIQHPHIMALYDVYETADELYLLLELVEGGELFDYLVKQGKLKEMEALTFFQQIIAGLDYCHKHLICHRDLKPENLLLDTQKKIKIADFGMASLQVTGKMLETSCGSPHYASPEIIRGVKYDGSAADIWSCGVILYALLTGNLPFDDENIRKLLQKVKSGVYVIPDTVPRDAADLIRKMLVLNPAKRITIKEIEQHPWFTKIPYNSKLSGDSPLRSPPSPESIKPLAPEDLPSVDVDIIASLGVLGYGTEEEIIKALISPEPNYEKVFYWVLRQKKTEFLENFDPEQEWTNSEGKSLKRRIGSHGSRTSLLGDRSSIYNSIYMSADTLQKSPPDSPTEDKKTPLPAKKTSISEVPTSDAPKKLSGDAQKRRSYNKSPLSATVSGEEDDNEFKPELVEKAKKAALQALEGQRPPQTDVNIESIFGIGEKSAAKSQGTLFEQFKNSVVIENARNPESDQYQSLPALAPNSKQVDDKRTNDQQAEQAEQYDMGTPKFHRKNLDLSVNISSSNLPLKHASGAMNQSSPSLFAHRSSEASLPSPNIVVTKKSWFANLFSFKPESFSVTTAGSLSDVLSRIQLKLKKENIDFQPSKDGNALKCRYDDFGRSNGVKFRISVIAKENGTVDVTCTQQQGALSAFHRFAEVFRADFN